MVGLAHARPPRAPRPVLGTLPIAFGATIIAGFGSAFAALEYPVPFSISLLVGICVMFLGFLRAHGDADRAPAN